MTHLGRSTFALLLAGTAGAVQAIPLQDIADLSAVTVYEATFSTLPTLFTPVDARLARLPDPLSGTNNDFAFFADEYYDVFYSDSLGREDPAGSYLTIEGVWRNTSIPNGGMNIAGVSLTVAGSEVLADHVARFVMGSLCDPGVPINCIPGSEALAVDGDLGTFPRFGHTSPTDLADRFSLTVGWDAYSVPIPEPASIVLLLAGLAGVAAARRAASSAR